MSINFPTQSFWYKVTTQWSPTTKGIALALVSTALFTVVGVIVRLLSDSIGVFQILLFRQLVFLTLLMPAIVINFASLRQPTHLKLHTFRILGAFTALSIGFVVVSTIPLANATALGFTRVLFVALLARLFLRETLSMSRILTLILGFSGVMLIVQPSFDDTSLGYIVLGLVASMGAAIAAICVRRIAQLESKLALLAYQALFVGILALVPSTFDWVWPSWNELLLLVSVGVISSIAQWFGVSAYKYGAANVVSNVEYVKIIYAMGIGYLLFSETPNQLAIIGVVLLFLSVCVPKLFTNRNK
ncbi:DMT family transporter [Vibrio sp. La 4.2.2]|uniref:DMT family transporter n=1 Tax=Vibrio sp. La 4.2.2 TaxID=2998830 RepID=UPI0022CE13F1|nr:DMT family transporter [Vibrio sp. La 4.2.2]MDA0106617.1 DMT family transporter [Vibrio sp. La 4.2.2]